MNHPIIKLLKESKYDISVDGKEHYHDLMLRFLTDLYPPEEHGGPFNGFFRGNCDIFLCKIQYDNIKKEMYFIDYFSDKVHFIFKNVDDIQINNKDIQFTTVNICIYSDKFDEYFQCC